MAQFPNIFNCDLHSGPVSASIRQMYLGDVAANRVGVRVTDNGEAVALSGTCSGTAMLYNGGTVALTGVVDGNVAYVDLPAAVYSVEGPLQIFVTLTQGGSTTTLLEMRSNVTRTETGVVIDPGTIISSVAALISDIEDAVASIPEDYSELSADVVQLKADMEDVQPAVETLEDDVSDLKSAITNGTFTEKSANLYRPMFAMMYDYSTAFIDGDKITVTATADRTYCSARTFIDVRNINEITVSYKSYSGTGSGLIRIGYSTDGQTHGGWIGAVDSNPKTFDVSGYDYIDVYLYAVYSSNKGIGKYITYDSIMINDGSSAKVYVPGLTAVDGVARNKTDELSLMDGVNYLSDKLINGGSSTMLASIMSLGDLSATGQPKTNVKYRGITVPIITFPFNAVITCTSAYYIRVVYYINGEYDSVVGWVRSVEIPEGQEFRILIRNAPEDTTITGNVNDFASAITVVNQDSTHGTGQQIYTGERIKLEADFNEKNRCDIVEWKDFVNATELRLYDNQSIAAFGGYMFVFVDAGGGIVLNMSTKEIVSQFTTAYSSNDHQNAAQFSDIYYSDSDEFPLLFISRCRGNNPDSGSENRDGCLIYRVTRSETQFTFTLINTILWDHITYGLDWSVDNGTRMLFTCSLQNGRYTVTENNPLVFAAFDLPTKAQILSGNTITLTDDDVRIRFEAEHATMQGSTAANGILYVAVVDETLTGVRQHIWAFDSVRQRVTTKVKLLNNLECEGVTIANGIMYVSQRRNSSSGDANPLKIYSIQF